MSLLYTAAGQTDIGKEREENQDAFHIDEKSGFFIVVDGMGGMQEGALAAKYVVEGLPAVLRERMGRQSSIEAKGIINSMKESVMEINSYLREKVGANTGATFVSVMVIGKKAYIAHLGDSRAYLFRKRKLKQLTKDHNVASLLVDMGKITAEQARIHPMRHRLTAYVGMQGNAIPEIKPVTLVSEDILLLCSDGLSGMMADQEIIDLLRRRRSLKFTLRSLITRANEAGGHDNITAMLIKFQRVNEITR